MDIGKKKELRNLAIVMVVFMTIQLVGMIALYRYLFGPQKFYVPHLKLHIMLERKINDSTGIIYISKSDTYGTDYIKYQWPYHKGNFPIHFLTPDSLYVINYDRFVKEMRSGKIYLRKIDYVYNSNVEHIVNDSNSVYQNYLLDLQDSVFIKSPHYVLTIYEDFRHISLYYYKDGYYYDGDCIYRDGPLI